MSRIFKFLAILFLIGGFLVYDRYTLEQGQTSPLAQVLSFLGLSKYIHWQANYNQTNNTLLNEKWNKFQLARTTIEKKRAEKIKNRLVSLQQLNQANDDIYNETLRRAQEWQNVKREKTKKFLEVIEAGKSVVRASKEQDLNARTAKFPQAKAIYWDEVTAALPDTADFKNLKASLDKLETVALGSGPLPANCPNQKVCLEMTADSFVRTMAKLFDNDLNQPLSLLDGLADSVQSLRREYGVISDNLSASDRLLTEHEQEWLTVLEPLPAQEAGIIPNAVRGLKKQYKKSFGEQIKIFVSIGFNRDRLQQTLLQALNRMAKAKQSSGSLPVEVKELVERIGNSFSQQQQVWQEFEKNEAAVTSLSRDWWQASGMLLDELSVEWKEEYVTQNVSNRGVQR